MTHPSVAVTIAQWGKVDYTYRCVQALLAGDYGGDIQVMVYDNASPEGPGPVADMDEVTLVRGDTNIGFGPAHNHLADLADAELLLILNNDTIMTPTALSTMVDAIEGDGIGAVSPRYIGFDGVTLEMGGYVFEDGWGWQLFRGARPPQYMTRSTFTADYGSAACLLTPRKLFVDSGGFDDLFAPAYYEDTDYCFGLRTKGHRIVVEPRAIVYHYEGATAGKDVSTGLKQLQEEHRSVFANRWKARISDSGSASQASALIRALALAGHAVLWVSPEFPRPDHEAGHARLVSMLRVLKEAGSAAALWAEMAPEWERYGEVLEREGIPWFAFRLSGRLRGENDAEYSTIQSLLSLGCWDVVIVSFPEMAKRIIPAVRSMCPEIPVLIDAVDLHFLREGRDPTSNIEEVEETKERELEIYRSSDGIIAASDHELELLTELVPNVPASVFSSVSTLEFRHESLAQQDGDPLFLGNLNHAPNVAAVDYWVKEVFPRLSDDGRRPLVLFGSATERFADRWPVEAVDVRGWAPDLQVLFAAARCFVAPLTFGAGTKGKILEAAAAGVPVVTTPVGSEGYSGGLVESLFVTDDPDAFAKYVEILMTDDEFWEKACVSALAGARDWEMCAGVEQSEWASWVRRRMRSLSH